MSARLHLLAGIAVALTMEAGAGWAAPPSSTRTQPRTIPPATVEPAPSAAGVDLAYGAYQRGLYFTAFREATARLDRSPKDAAAMTLLGELYNQGLGVGQSAKEAADWYGLAAKNGDANAMATLGLMAMDGRGVAKDPAAGRSWLEKAAALGEPTASFNLALLLLTSGTPDDLARAAKLLQVAANAEIGDAQHALGVMYARGQGGLPADPARAAELYLKASRNGSVAGEVEYAIVQFNGDGIAKNEAAAARHFRRAAARGNAIAQNRLARLYTTGRGVPRNLVEAAAWHLLAAGQGLPDSWLDGALRDLPPSDRTRAEQLAAERSDRT